MNKYVVIARFEWSEEAMQVIDDHRAYINSLIDDQVIEHYAVSMEAQTVWITINAKSKAGAKKILSKTPFRKYWTLDVHELIIWDGQSYRLPAVQLN